MHSTAYIQPLALWFSPMPGVHVGIAPFLCEAYRERVCEALMSVNAAAEQANAEANQAFAAGDIKKAIEGYSRAIGIDATTAKYFGNRSNAYLQQAKFQKAAHDADKAIAIDGSVVKFYYRAAVAYFENGDLNTAADRLRGLLKLDATNADGLKLAQLVREKQDAGLDCHSSAGAKILGPRFLAALDSEDNVYRLPSGMRFRVKKKVTAADAKSPTVDDECLVHYHGTLVDGTVFDSSYDRQEAATFAPNQVITGWTEALQYMAEGEKWEVYLPYDLAYGANGAGDDIPPFSTLIFTIELLKVNSGGKAIGVAHEKLSQQLGKTYESLVES